MKKQCDCTTKIQHNFELVISARGFDCLEKLDFVNLRR